MYPCLEQALEEEAEARYLLAILHNQVKLKEDRNLLASRFLKCKKSSLLPHVQVNGEVVKIH